MVAAVDRILLDIGQGVVHPAHVPLVRETQAAEIHGPGHARKRCRLLRRHDRAGVLAVGQGVQLAEKIDRLDVLAPAELVGHPVPRPFRKVQVQHRRDRVHAQAVGVVLVEPEQRVREEEVADLVPPVVEHERAPVALLALERIGVLEE